MSKLISCSLFLALLLYTFTFLALEFNTSQEHVRQYFYDIHGDVAFYGLNTSLSAYFLWSVVIIFSVCATIARLGRANRREYYF